MAQYRIQNFTALAGTVTCDAKCGFCVANMTTPAGVNRKPAPLLPERWFRKALVMAENRLADSFLITGKGEPTLFPEHVNQYLDMMNTLGINGKSSIPFWEMQSNVLRIGDMAEGKQSGIPGLEEGTLGQWFAKGLDLFAISRVDVDDANNSIVYRRNMPNLGRTIRYLRDMGFHVRLCIMMHEGMVNGPDAFERVLAFCIENSVDQLTIRAIRKPVRSESTSTSQYVAKNGITEEQEVAFFEHVSNRGSLIRHMLHGAMVFDVDGQNVCMSDCLTIEPENQDIRSLIFEPVNDRDAKIYTQWDYKGSVIV